MKGKLDSLLEADMELKLIQVDYYGVVFSIFRHLIALSHVIEMTAILLRGKMIEKMSRCEPGETVSDVRVGVNLRSLRSNP